MAMLVYLQVNLAYCNFVTDYKAECNELRFQEKKTHSVWLTFL